MITPAEALQLRTARLTCEELGAVEVLQDKVEAHIRQHMRRGGVQLDITETRAAVVVELQSRIRRAGWQLQTLAMEEASRVTDQRRVIGYRLVLSPPDDAGGAGDIIASA